MLREIRPAFVILALITVITGLAYPLAVAGIGQAVFPRQANGSLVERNGQVIGSALIGQTFTGPGYFHPRPSATTAPDPADATKTVPSPYNAAGSLASNLGPTAKALIDRVQADTTALEAENPDAVAAGLPVPADLVTTSASGLDPDISPAAARFQAARVAKARNLPQERVLALVNANTAQPLLGFLGEPQVNVLALNLALDGLH
jgi:potassium-transporting ATPase KdpC subunit